MWIRALSVRHFAGIRSVDLELVAGLNVLHGPNELGKSTLVTAIRAALLLQDGATVSQSFVDWHTDQPPQVTPDLRDRAAAHLARAQELREGLGRLELSRLFA